MKKVRIVVLLVVVIFFSQISCTIAQLSSVEVLSSVAGINNPDYRMNATHDLGFRFNQKIGWIWSGNLTVGINTTNFNVLPATPNFLTDLSNTYNFYQVGTNFNILTALRTLKEGWSEAKWQNRIAFKGFKWYLCGGVEFLKLKHSSDKNSSSKVTNVFGGMGFEIYRLGRGARKQPSAFVPFIETKYYINTSGGYYSSPESNVTFNKISAALGLKYTFALPPK